MNMKIKSVIASLTMTAFALAAGEHNLTKSSKAWTVVADNLGMFLLSAFFAAGIFIIGMGCVDLYKMSKPQGGHKPECSGVLYKWAGGGMAMAIGKLASMAVDSFLGDENNISHDTATKGIYK